MRYEIHAFARFDDMHLSFELLACLFAFFLQVDDISVVQAVVVWPFIEACEIMTRHIHLTSDGSEGIAGTRPDIVILVVLEYPY